MSLKAPKGGCTVRMYRHGLGDCFLLALGAQDGEQTYVLIDCGVLLGTPNAESTMQQVAQDINQATDSHLNALIITHEHWDHVSGFVQAQAEFSNLEVDEVWFAWTEEPGNALADELRARRREAFRALQLGMGRLQAAGSRHAERISSVMGYLGEPLGVDGRTSTETALDWVKKRWPNHRYCRPGMTPLQLAGIPSCRFFVLGPPEDKELLRKSLPSRRHSEVYLDDGLRGRMSPFFSGLGVQPGEGLRASSSTTVTEGLPFNPAYRVSAFEPDIASMNQLYAAEPWRQIQDNWLEMAGELALRLDSHTNNTSLAVAIELAPGGKVLLFPGDAQVGNWLSWQDLTWQGEASTLTSSDLLRRTVLYKVGHHGSHNATLRQKGLELMTSKDLSALIPVDQAIARKLRWHMPHLPLYERLVDVTDGRVILSDEGIRDSAVPSGAAWFAASVSETERYIDVTVLA